MAKKSYLSKLLKKSNIIGTFFMVIKLISSGKNVLLISAFKKSTLSGTLFIVIILIPSGRNVLLISTFKKISEFQFFKFFSFSIFFTFSNFQSFKFSIFSAFHFFKNSNCCCGRAASLGNWGSYLTTLQSTLILLLAIQHTP